jgi:hypothetical protein
VPNKRVFCLAGMVLTLFFCTLESAAQAQLAPAPERVGAQQSRFQRTVQHLQGESPALRADFAAIALGLLGQAYATEARLAGAPGTAARSNGKRGWALAVSQFARQMPLLVDDIELGFPVHLNIGADRTVAVTVADRTVMLNHPRINQQGAFERDILQSFCATVRCDAFWPADEPAAPIPFTVASITPEWAFTPQGQVCSYRGLGVRFDAARNLANARVICEQFLQEAVTLREELAWQQRHAVIIDWDNLDIQAAPHRPEHMVRLNAAGDTVLVTIPVLYGNPELVASILPWLQQPFAGQSQLRLELDAARFGWQRP